MRQHRLELDSPEANFMFGGTYTEQVYRLLNGRIAPYSRADAATDTLFSDETSVPTHQKKVELIRQITRNLISTTKIEKIRQEIADYYNKNGLLI